MALLLYCDVYIAIYKLKISIVLEISKSPSKNSSFLIVSIYVSDAISSSFIFPLFN